MKFTIDRSKWCRGGLDVPTALLVHQDGPNHGKMCCLGFYALALGFGRHDIRGEGEPSEIASDLWPPTCAKIEEMDDNEYDDDGKLITYQKCIQTPWTDTAIKINDDSDLDDEQRENLLTEHFASVGDEVEFVG